MNNRRPLRFLSMGLLSLVLLSLLTLRLTSVAQAAPQACLDIANITVCADQQTDFSGGLGLRGNVKIGPKGGPMVVLVTDNPATFNGLTVDDSVRLATYFHLNAPDPNTGATDFLIGQVKFINDPTGLDMMGVAYVDDPTSSNPSDIVVGRLFVDRVNRRIFLPAAGAVPVFNQKGIPRNAAYRLAFMSQAGALTFYKDGGSVQELGLVDAEFDLNTKKFKSTLPVDLKLGDAAENPNLRVTMRFQWTETRQFTGTVDGFKLRLAGLLMEATGMVVKAATGSSTAEFEAATVKVLKADNPDVPGLDPTDASLIFAFTKLKYKNGDWSIGGVEVPVKDWEFGAAFKMISQTLGVIKEQGVQAIQIRSTMQFGAGNGASKLPIVLKIGRAQVNGQFKPVFQAGLQNISPKLGIMTFNLQGVTFVGDGAQNFYGIQATTAALQWPPFLGGQTAAGVQGFKLGIDKDRKLKFQLGAGTVGLPPLENKVFRAVLQATVGVQEEVVVLTGTGTFTLRLPGNTNSAGFHGSAILRYSKDVAAPPPAAVVASSAGACVNALGEAVSCPGVAKLAQAPAATPPKPFEMVLNGFNVKIAGFGLNVTAARGLDDGGFAADSVGVSLPVGLNTQGNSSGITINGLVVKGDGTVSVQGGGFELPSLSVGGVQLVGMRGSFAKLRTGDYEFTAGGKFPLPGIEPGTNSPGISAQIAIRANAAGAFTGMGVQVAFTAVPGTGIPIGSTGMELTGIGGLFDLNNSTVQIGVTLKASSLARIPAPLSLPLATVNTGVTLQFNPFLMTANADVSLLVFKVAQASVKIGHQQGFNNGNGMFVSGQINGVIVHGSMSLRVGKIAVAGQQKTRVVFTGGLTLGIEKGQFGVGKPPFDIFVAGVQFAGGKFRDKRVSPNRDVGGVLGTLIIGPLRPSVFLNFGAGSGFGTNGFIDLANADKFQLIDSQQLRAAAARGAPGLASRRLNAEEAAGLGLSQAWEQAGPSDGMLQDSISVVVTQTTTLVAGINYTTGSPTLRLTLPDNSQLNESVNTATRIFRRTTDAETGTDAAFVIGDATPGTYTLIIDNAPAEYQQYSYELNNAGAANFTSVTCGGATIVGVAVECDGAAAGGTVSMAWNTTDADSPDARVSAGYVPVPAQGETVDLSTFTPLAEGLAIGAGTQQWTLDQVPSGQYQAAVMIEDGANPPVVVTHATVIAVEDHKAPAPPTGLTAVSQAGEMLVKWNQNTELDLAGYEIGFGLFDDPAQFVYTRTLGAKEVITGTNNIVDAKLWGLDDNVEIYYGLRAYDLSSNYSAWTSLAKAKPWALSPNTWSPEPNGVGSVAIEIAFLAPLQTATLAGALTVKDENGNTVPGAAYQLVLLDEQKVVGLGFRPNHMLVGKFTATLKGGANGIKAEDGRTLNGDYSWSFTLAPQTVFMPLAVQP